VQNLVNKYVSESDTVAADDEGVVAIEYVVVAAAIVAALAVLWANFGDTLNTKLDAIVNGI
jgi:Flp pilus assembly pilin Flp